MANMIIRCAIVPLCVLFCVSCLDLGYNDQGFTELMEATRSGNAPKVQRLLAKGADPNKGSIEKGYRIHGTPYEGQTALIIASKLGNYSIAKLLVDAGGNVMQHDSRYQTAASYACKEGHQRIVRLLFDSTQPGAEETSYRSTVVHCILQALERNEFELARQLLENHSDNISQGSLACLISNLHLQWLLDNGISPNIFNKGMTPLMRAAYGHREAWRVTPVRLLTGERNVPLSSLERAWLLLKNHADPNMVDDDLGRTALMWVVLGPISSSSKVEVEEADWIIKMLKVLLDAGANPDIKDKDGNTVLDKVRANVYANTKIETFLKAANSVKP